ncbi:hypothetical protein [Bacillus paranthracis]|uniref:hypothetical protein n=1 Tax=Bacillus paranthracis TaxID=2026186 RepID=UPI003D65AA71|nr:hypothetical protein [Bacillus cereus]
MYKCNLTEEQEQGIIASYLEGNKKDLVGEQFSVSKWKVTEVLTRHGIKQRTGGQARSKYQCNESFFDVIDTEEKAYWLGFLAADGFLRSDKDQWGVTLSTIDKSHLEKLKNSIEATHPVNEFIVNRAKGYFSCRLFVASKQMKDALVKNGVVEKKTDRMLFPTKEQVPDHLIRHYARGYFDGDGSFYMDSRGRLIFNLLGTEEFLIGFKEAFDIENKVLKDARSIVHYISVGAREKVLNLMNYLYEDATIYLERKYQKYIKITGPAGE